MSLIAGAYNHMLFVMVGAVDGLQGLGVMLSSESVR